MDYPNDPILPIVQKSIKSSIEAINNMNDEQYSALGFKKIQYRNRKYYQKKKNGERKKNIKEEMKKIAKLQKILWKN